VVFRFFWFAQHELLTLGWKSRTRLYSRKC